jgi:hypothetical protein
MTADEVWLPASGCLPCPFQLSLPKSWDTINPLPGFVKPGGGYFSVPLKAWYLPIQSCITLGNFAVGEIDSSDIDLFWAIAAHELIGHGNNIGPFFEFPRKQLLRIFANLAYRDLQEVMENGQHEKFWGVCAMNAAIAAGTTSMALVEELYATLRGIESLREENLIPSHIINRIEDQFVENHSNPDYFGSKFRELYTRLSKLFHMLGDEPIRIIALFAGGKIDPENMVDILYGHGHEVEERGEKRFHEALEFLEGLQYPAIKQEWQKLTGKEWLEFLYHNLPGFSQCIDDYHPLLETFKRLYEDFEKHSSNFDWDPLHSFVGGNRVLVHVVEPDSDSQLKVPTDLIKCTANSLSDEYCEAIWKEVYKKFFNAQANNRTLVFMYNKALESSVPGFGLVPAAVEDTDALMPVPRCTPGWDLSLIEDRDRFDEWLRRRNVGGSKVYKLNFYEGLRQQVAVRCGLQCPLRLGERPLDIPCCGGGRLLLELFKAGEKAAAIGWHYTKWEMPQECLRFASERI